MGRKIAGNCDENVPALVGVAPLGELPDARLQHLIGMEASVFAQQCASERCDQRMRRVAKRQMTSDQPRREIDLSLPVKSVKQRGADRLGLGRQIVERLRAIAWDAGRGTLR